MEATPKEVLVCEDKNGRLPFCDWLDTLNARTEAIVLQRIDRIEEGNFGAVEPVGEGVSELKIDFGPGYRVYFGQIGNEVPLINGGSEKQQQHDIIAAKKFWRAHDSHN